MTVGAYANDMAIIITTLMIGNKNDYTLYNYLMLRHSAVMVNFHSNFPQ